MPYNKESYIKHVNIKLNWHKIKIWGPWNCGWYIVFTLWNINKLFCSPEKKNIPTYNKFTLHTFKRKVFLKEFFLVKIVKNISEMEWNSFICFTVDKENCGELVKQQRKVKNRTRCKLMLCFLSELLCLSFISLNLYWNRPFYLNSLIFNRPLYQ